MAVDKAPLNVVLILVLCRHLHRRVAVGDPRTHFVGPVAVHFDPTVFHHVGHHDDNADTLLMHHRPEVGESLLPMRGLTGDCFRQAWLIDIRRIDVVMRAGAEFDPKLIIRHDVAVPITIWMSSCRF